MTTIEAKVDRELEIFRAECETAAQFLYGYLAIHEIASRNQRIFRLLDENALFWKTVERATGMNRMVDISLLH